MRDEVLSRIRERVSTIMSRTEIVRIEVEPDVAGANKAVIHDVIWHHFSTYANYPIIDQLYYEIEQPRDLHRGFLHNPSKRFSLESWLLFFQKESKK